MNKQTRLHTIYALAAAFSLKRFMPRSLGSSLSVEWDTSTTYSHSTRYVQFHHRRVCMCVIYFGNASLTQRLNRVCLYERRTSQVVIIHSVQCTGITLLLPTECLSIIVRAFICVHSWVSSSQTHTYRHTHCGWRYYSAIIRRQSPSAFADTN